MILLIACKQGYQCFASTLLRYTILQGLLALSRRTECALVGRDENGKTVWHCVSNDELFPFEQSVAFVFVKYVSPTNRKLVLGRKHNPNPGTLVSCPTKLLCAYHHPHPPPILDMIAASSMETLCLPASLLDRLRESYRHRKKSAHPRYESARASERSAT